MLVPHQSRSRTPNLSGKVAFVTGASGALGADLARALKKKGVRLALVARNEQKLRELEAQLGGADAVLAIAGDVRSLASMEKAVQAAVHHFGAIDIVVAAAGMATTRLGSEYTEDDFAADLDTNLNGVWRTFRAALPYVRKSRGHLCAVSSLAAYVHLPAMSAYAASKAGVAALCNSLRLELDGTGVTVGTIHPTFFESAIGNTLETDPTLSDATATFAAPFSPMDRAAVVEATVRSIEQRSRTIVLPSLFHAASLVPGVVQRALEPLVRHNARSARRRRSSSAPGGAQVRS